MKTKTCLLAVLLMFVAQAVFSQSLDDAKKAIYYEHYSSAKQALQSMISSKPDAETYYYLGIAELNLDSVQAAKSAFQKGIQADDEFALNYVGLGRVAIANKDYAAAKPQFQKAWDMTKGREFDVVRGILKATATDPKADAQYALDLVQQFKDNRRNRRYEFTAADYTAIGNVYANLPSGGGKAATNFENAARVNAQYAKAFYLEGNLWDRARQDSLALMYWNKAISADSSYTPAYYELFAYYRVRDLDKARSYLDKYMAQVDDKLNAQIYLVDVLYLQKNYQQAIDQAHQLMNKPISEDTKTRLYKLIAVSQMASGDTVSAKKSMDTYFQQEDTADVLPFDYKTYADIMGGLGNDSLQLVYLNKFVDKDTTTNLAFIRETANTLRENNNFKAADLWFQKLFSLADTTELTMADYYYRAFSKYGAALKGQGSYDSAEVEWKKFIKAYPDQPSGYFYLGRSLQAKDTAYSGLAVDAYNKYLEILNEKPEEKKEKTDILRRIYAYKAGVAATNGNESQTMQALQPLLQLDPHSPVAANIYANLAYKAAKNKDLNKATQLANQSLEINPSNATAPQVLNYVQQMKDYRQKMQEYKEAQQKNGGSQ